MAVNNPRNRVLIFRLTQDEFAELHAASTEHGARSLSDFARAKLFGRNQSEPVEQQLAELKTTVARIAKLLEDGRTSPPLMAQPQNGAVEVRVEQQ